MLNSMQLYEIKACTNPDREEIRNLEFVLIDPISGNTLTIPRIGPAAVDVATKATCKTFTLGRDEVIE